MEHLPTSLIQYFEKHHHVSAPAIQAIAAITSPIFIQKNKILQPVGHTCRTIYFISKGSARIWGMLLQGLAILWIPFSSSFFMLAVLSTVLGLGTALVYPTFLSAIAQTTSPEQRAESIGTFRLWRDLGYAFGAIISGITADLFGVEYAIFLIGGLTIISSLIIKIRMPESIQI
ncbi:MAG: MFS transporter [Saprospiraceae bacterium]